MDCVRLSLAISSCCGLCRAGSAVLGCGGLGRAVPGRGVVRGTMAV